jgi:hypothetical protein
LVLSCGGTAPRSDGSPALRSPYVRDLAAARAALDELTQHTLARPRRAERLFVEGYFMRSLVAAHDVLGPAGTGAIDAAAARRLLEPAIAFAETLVVHQNEHGYWDIAYASSWLADMGAALGLFQALEPHVPEASLARWQLAAERFATVLERDKVLLDSGALGVGWPVEGDPRRIGRAWRSDMGYSDSPYLVSTALVGIEVHAWLYRRTGEAKYRQRALAALEYTLGRLQSDGSLPAFSKHEGALATAANVAEGWMAADLLLDDPAVRARLCATLPRHVDYLVRSQRPDGTWDSGVSGESARTPSIASFLVWYDARCEARDDVRQALQRTSRLYTDRARRRAYGLLAPGDAQEIRRAITGRPLAALVAGRPIL